MEFNIKHTFDNLSPHFSGVKNAVKSFCSELGLCREMKRVSNSLYGSIMARPVGIVSKNYDFIRATLKRNIGSGATHNQPMEGAFRHWLICINR